jgi:hypothetical protein
MYHKKYGYRELLDPLFSVALVASVLTGCLLSNNSNVASETFLNNPVIKMNFHPTRQYVTVGDTIPLFIEGLHKGYDCGTIIDITASKQQDTLSATWSLEWPENSHNCQLISSVDSLGDSVWQYSFASPLFSEGPVYLRGDGVGDSAFLTQALHRSYLLSNALDTTWMDSVGGIDWNNGVPTFIDVNLQDSTVNILELSGVLLSSSCGDSLSYVYYCTNASQDSLFMQLSSISQADCVPQDPSEDWRYQSQYFHSLPNMLQDSSRTCLQNLQEL